MGKKKKKEKLLGGLTGSGRLLASGALVALLLIMGSSPAESSPGFPKKIQKKSRYAKLPLGPDGKPRPLSLEEAVRIVLNHNVELQVQQLEILKANTALQKEEAKYAPLLGFRYQAQRKIEKPTGNTIFTGTKISNEVLAAGISRLFSTGTYFQVEVSDTRYDTNAGEGPGVSGLLARLAERPLHYGALRIVLRQELVKNAFGYSQRRLKRIARNQSAIEEERLAYGLSQLIVKTMIDYWSLAIAEENLSTAETLLKNARSIRNITIRKKRIGLAEYFEVNQWNALVAQSEARLRSSKLNRDNARRTVLRTLNLPPNLELSGSSRLSDTLPTDINFAKDLKWALQTRPDLKNLRFQAANARATYELSRNNLLPSVTIGGSLAHRDLGLQMRSSFREVPSGKYPDYSVEFKVEYPLGDTGTKADVRNARVAMRQLAIQENDLKRRIRDEVKEGIERIRTNFEILKKIQLVQEQTLSYYQGLLRRYRQGRFTAVAIKNALDSLAQSRQSLTQARINYNISLVRYELVRNYLFQKFNINVKAIRNRYRRYR